MPKNNRSKADIANRLGQEKGPGVIQAIAAELHVLHQNIEHLEIALEQVLARQQLTEHLFSLKGGAITTEALPAELDILPQHLFDPQDGFHRLERTSQGQPFRWTGPQRSFSFTVCVNRSAPLTVSLEALAMMDEARQHELCLLVDGLSLPFTLAYGETGYVGQAVLPAAASRTMTKLTFVVPVVLHVPPPTSDERELGIGFTRLTIRPARPEQAAGAIDGSTVSLNDKSTEPVREDIPVKALSFTAEQIQDCHPGFHALEFTGEGLPYRWTDDRSTFSFTMQIDRRTPLELTLTATAAVDLDEQSRIEVTSDNQQYELPLRKSADELVEGRMVLPARPAAGLTKLQFAVKALPQDTGEKQRVPGIAFHRLEIRPLPDAPSALAPARKVRARKQMGSRNGKAPAAVAN